MKTGWVAMAGMGTMVRHDWCREKIHFVTETRNQLEASAPFELLLSVSRERPGTLGAQIEDQLRRAIRGGELHAGTRVPSTRDLARQLGVSRRIAVDAYAQLAAEGYLVLRQGAQPRVADGAAVEEVAEPAPLLSEPAMRFDFRPSRPDVSSFPRRAWARCLRDAVATIPDADLIYGDPCGVETLRTALADYLGRVRGVVAEPGRIVVTSGYIQGLGLVCRALAAGGVQRIAIEDPSAPEQGPIAKRAGLEPAPVPVDASGLVVDALDGLDAGAVVLTPAHQHPTGVVLTPERRGALVEWLRERGAYAIEDDYDAEYRYDRAAVGALQGLEPDRVVYCGSASKTLAPALRLGWMAVPAALLAAVRYEKSIADQTTARIEQHAMADFIGRGELDRHLRRMRLSYRARRDAMLEALERHLPDAAVTGIAAGLHATVTLSRPVEEAALLAECDRRRVAISTLSDYREGAFARTPTLLLGYAQLHEAAIPAAVAELAAAARAAAAA
jgi:GntR family transcriptional regulator/MocR family aminotransferase